MQQFITSKVKNYSIHILFIFLFLLSFKIEAQTKKADTVLDKQQTDKKNKGNTNGQKTADAAESNLKNAVSSNTVTSNANTTNSESPLKTAVSSNTLVIYTDTTGNIRNTKN